MGSYDLSSCHAEVTLKDLLLASVCHSRGTDDRGDEIIILKHTMYLYGFEYVDLWIKNYNQL